MRDPTRIWTVGHSNHAPERFLELVTEQSIEFLVDVRSYPYSRFAPHFDREEVEQSLREADIRYLFLGEELGGRPSSEEHFDEEGHALYGEMAALPAFSAGIDRLLDGAGQGRLAIMCSCGKPDECHRRLLVGKVLTERGVELVHILPSGELRPEQHVPIGAQGALFGEAETPWRSTQSVSHRRRLNTGGPARLAMSTHRRLFPAATEILDELGDPWFRAGDAVRDLGRNRKALAGTLIGW